MRTLAPLLVALALVSGATSAAEQSEAVKACKAKVNAEITECKKGCDINDGPCNAKCRADGSKNSRECAKPK